MRPLLTISAGFCDFFTISLLKVVPRSAVGVVVTLTVLAAGVNLARDARVGASFPLLGVSAEASDEWGGI